MRFIFGIFFILHGLVHMLYAGHAAGYFELKPGMTWPDGSWAFSRLIGNGAIRNLAGISLVLVSIALVAGGVGALANLTWWRALVSGTVVFSSILFILFWNGGMQNLDGQGLVGILINLAILFSVLKYHLPAVE